MAVRPPINLERSKETRQRAGKLTGRIYLLWILGIAIGAVQLKVPHLRKVIYQFRKRRMGWFERWVQKGTERLTESSRDRRRFRRAKYLGAIFLTRFVGLTYFFLPLVHILGWRREELGAALNAVMH
jgi:hypothetical protein